MTEICLETSHNNQHGILREATTRCSQNRVTGTISDISKGAFLALAALVWSVNVIGCLRDVIDALQSLQSPHWPTRVAHDCSNHIVLTYLNRISRVIAHRIYGISNFRPKRGKQHKILPFGVSAIWQQIETRGRKVGRRPFGKGQLDPVRDF